MAEQFAAASLAGLGRVVSAVVRAFVLLALTAAAGVGALGLVLARGGYDAAEIVVTVLLLAPPAVVLLFAAGIREVLDLPDRLRRLPQHGAAQLGELSRLAGEARTAGWRRAPFLLWRLRGVVASTRELVGFALLLRVLTVPFLGLTFAALLVSLLLIGVGVIALLVLAVS